MEVSEDRYMLVFESYNQAILLYRKLLEKKCIVELISTPCRISRGCSQSVVFTVEETKVVIEEAKKNNIVVRGIYKIVTINGVKNYIHI